jgi:hypothetical protein
MSKGFSLAGDAVARGLKITRTTHMLVLAVVAGVASNATVAMQYSGLAGQIVLAVLIFASLAAGMSAISTDIYSRSSQTISNLRSIGATRGSISSAVTFPVLVYSAIGSVLGAGIGAAIGASFGHPGPGNIAVDVLAVVLTASAASVAGVYAGGRAAWRS